MARLHIESQVFCELPGSGPGPCARGARDEVEVAVDGVLQSQKQPEPRRWLVPGTPRGTPQVTLFISELVGRMTDEREGGLETIEVGTRR